MAIQRKDRDEQSEHCHPQMHPRTRTDQGLRLELQLQLHRALPSSLALVQSGSLFALVCWGHLTCDLPSLQCRVLSA